MSDKEIRKLLTIKELAEVLRISTSKVYELASAKEIPHVRIGRRVLFKPSAIEKWLEEKEEAPSYWNKYNEIRPRKRR